jgi:putative DNA primase/helicase
VSADILTTVLELHAAGYSVIPIKADGSKAPALPSWKRYTTERADVDALHAWFDGDDPYDLGVVQGAISGAAELTEVEGRAAAQMPALRDLAIDAGLGDLWDTITRGWVEMSPSGGFHFHYRITDAPVPGNLKLARAADKLVLAETRGEGGQVVVAPSRHHATGRPWVRLAGGPTTAASITLAERDAFHSILRTLDQTPDVVVAAPSSTPRAPGEGITPGDDYENKVDWADILTPHGWTLVSARGRTRYWLRPGKQRGQGISATTGHADDRDRLYVFTSSTDFAQEVPHTKLGALAVLEHGGDHNAAAKALYDAGFGQRREIPRVTPSTFFDDILGPGGTLTAQAGTCPAQSGTAPDADVAPTPVTLAPPAPVVTVVAEPAFYSETDDGNALRLIDTHARTVRYVPQRAQWLTWDGHRWAWDEAGRIRELARDIARNLPADDKEARRHRKTAMSRRGIEAMVNLAQTDPRTTTHLERLDARPYELNTPAGVVNLRTAQLGPPDPAALHTRTTTVAPNPDAPHRLWDRFLADTFAGDPAMSAYVQRLLGLSLVGVVLEQVFPFCYGAGANGKSTLMSVAQRLVGLGAHGYAMSAPASLLLATRNEGHPTELARLSGARLVATSELEDGQRFAEAKIKLLTGKDTVTGRFMNRDFFDFTPTHTLWVLANTQPAVRTGGVAFWRRVRLLAFEHTVPPEARISDLEDQLVEIEGPAILAWMLQGAADYFAHGLAEPDTVRAATDAYERDQDSLARFVDERCETGSPAAQHMTVKSGALRAAYETWCRTEGEEPLTVKGFVAGLRARFGVIPERSSAARYLTGIRLQDVEDDVSPDDSYASSDPPDASRDPANGWQQEGW